MIVSFQCSEKSTLLILHYFCLISHTGEVGGQQSLLFPVDTALSVSIIFHLFDISTSVRLCQYGRYKH